MKKLLVPGCLMVIFSSAYALNVQSPDGNTVLTTGLTESGVPVYTVSYKGVPVVADAPLGFVSNIADFSKGLTEKSSRSQEQVKRSYTQDRIKKSRVDVDAVETGVIYQTADGKEMEVEWHVGNNNVAFRYNIPAQGETHAIVINAETGGFAFPEGTSTFLSPQSDPMIGWKRTKPSYEEYYTASDMGTPSQYGRGYIFPALFQTPDGMWALVGETGVNGYYCGSHLTESQNGVYRVAFPMAEENNGNGSDWAAMALPGKTPWRTITVGDSLAPIVETTVTWDLVEPLYATSRPARDAKGTWSWILWQDDSINMEDQKKFVDLAAALGYDNFLIDCAWDVNIGYEKMPELFEYAKARGVRPILWFSSSGHWNDIVQSPVNKMDRPIVRKQTMKWLKENGVDAIKVDFFGGDKQETMRLYEDILSDAADYGIDVIFHGCTLPRGWERMYPNYVGSEAVLASENMIFSQEYCDREANQAAFHPFIRNAQGSMEYGGSFLNHRMSRDNKGGKLRKTTDAFQLALSVIYQNPVQNFALAPNNLEEGHDVALEWLKAVPTTWDDIRFIDGYPGEYIVLARRHGDTWYVAGINATDKEMPMTLKLPMAQPKEEATLIMDPEGVKAGKYKQDKNPYPKPIKRNIKLDGKSQYKLKLAPSAGFVMTFEAK